MKENNEKRNVDLTRVNINLPSEVVSRVKEYADCLGLPITQTYVVLINFGLEQKELIKNLPKFLNLITEFNENVELINNLERKLKENDKL